MRKEPLPLFYGDPRPLRSGTDAALSVSRDWDYAFARHAVTIPLVAADLAEACKHYPIVFTRDVHPWPLALVGLRRGENLFVDGEGKWEAGAYIPAYVRRYPFILLEMAGLGEPALGIDARASSLTQGGGNPLFRDGEPTDMAANALSFCLEYQAQYDLMAAFAQAAADADLLVDAKAGAALNSGEAVKLTGFRTIDAYRFSLLPRDELVTWRDRGWLMLATCHLVSMRTMARLFARLGERDPLTAAV
jgi:hypothetical protein